MWQTAIMHFGVNNPVLPILNCKRPLFILESLPPSLPQEHIGPEVIAVYMQQLKKGVSW